MASATPNQPDDYLSAIWLLTTPVGERPKGRRQPTAPARIADFLDVSRATVGDMLHKLEQRGLVERGDRKEALLTDEGRALAMRTVRKYRVVACFLVDYLGYELHEVSSQIAALVDGFSDDALERLYDRLGGPERSPHGFPIDPDHELRENATLTLAHRARIGDEATVVRVAERDAGIQQWCREHGIAPGVAVTVNASDEAGSVAIHVGSHNIVCDERTARGIYLRPSGVPVVPATASCWADILKRERALSAS